MISDFIDFPPAKKPSNGLLDIRNLLLLELLSIINIEVTRPLFADLSLLFLLIFLLLLSLEIGCLEGSHNTLPPSFDFLDHAND